MFNPVFQTVYTSQIILNRLARVQNTLRTIVAYTQVDYQSQVFSAVNQVLNLGNNMLPPYIFGGQTPAIIGDLTNNFTNLNNDGQDVAAEVTSIETNIAQFYNLTAGIQNSLRQSIREQVYASTSSEWLDAFITDTQLQSGYTASLDFDAGVATNVLGTDTVENPDSIVIGPSSVSNTATSNASYNPMQLLNPTNSPTNLVIWYGEQLELQLQFNTPIVLNRLVIQQDNYQGLQIVSLTSSPDGIYYDDIDAELFPTDLTLNAQSGKFSGDAIIDFNPRNVSVMKIVIADLIDQGQIALRGITAHQRTYSNTGLLTSNPISSPSNAVTFNTLQRTYNQLTSITHQLSYDGAHFQVIIPGSILTLTSSPFWYRAQLQTIVAGFTTAASPLATGSGDPNYSANYVIQNITSSALSSSVLQRNIVFTSVSGPIVLNETPVPNTLAVYYGSVLQPATAYVFTNNTLTLNSLPQSNVTVRYQTSTLGTAGLAALQNYFSPYLFEVSFKEA